MLRTLVTAFQRAGKWFGSIETGSRSRARDAGRLPDEVVEGLGRLGLDAPRVLCVGVSETDERSGEWPRRHGIRAVAIEPGDLGNWMIRTRDLTLDRWDLIVVGGQTDAETLSLLRARIHARTSVAVSLPETRRAEPPGSLWGVPDVQIGDWAIYRKPPALFQDPVSRDRQPFAPTSWFNRSEPLVVPPRMPSGRDWPRISIVTVTLNQAAFIEETLRSVLMQGYPNLEYLVLDGQSTDGTHDILERYSNELAFWRSEKDEGQADALNKGFARATGDILAWLNSDDRYLPETLVRVALAFDTYDADVVVGGCELTRDRSDVYETHHSYFAVGKVQPLPIRRLLDVDGAWLKGDFFWQPEVFWRRALWERAGGHVARHLYYCMDYDLWVRMAQAKATIVHVPDSLAIFRFHKQQKTSPGEALPYVPELRRVSSEYLARI
jgi:GT2 family glycosyltransferase